MPEPCWNAKLPVILSQTIAKLINDPRRAYPAWNLEEESPRTCHDLREHLEKFDRAGFFLREYRVLQALISENYDSRIAMSWLAYDTLPRLRETQIRFHTLETTLDFISQSLFDLVKDISKALSEEHEQIGVPNSTHIRLDRLSAVVQTHKDARYYDHKTDTLQPIVNITKGMSADERYKLLVDRIQALEGTVNENRNQIESLQSIPTADASRVVGTQEMESPAQAYRPTFEAMSDASESSTCTFTPASTVMNRLTAAVNNIRNGDEMLAAPLRLSITVHAIDEHRLQPTRSVLVRMHPNTPFKFLKDKLRVKYSDRELMLSPLEYVFDSDTPASLKLEKDAELIYASIDDGTEFIDLAI